MDLKNQACRYKTCLLPAVAQEAIAAAIFSKWGVKKGQYVLPASFFAVFRISSHFSCTKNEIRAGKLLVDPGHLQEELEGGHPHQRYRNAGHQRPVVDRALQKNTHIADDHAKI